MKFVPGKSVMMDASSVKMLCDILKHTSKVLEWGSGVSTLFFSRFVERWDSVEHDAGWAESVRKYLAHMDPPLPSVSLHHPVSVLFNDLNTTKECIDLDQTVCQTPTKCKDCRLFRPYVAEPTKWNNTFDVLLIDGRARVDQPEVARHSL